MFSAELFPKRTFVQNEMHEMDFFFNLSFFGNSHMENFLSEKKLQVIFFRHTFRHADLYTMRYAFHHRTSHEFLPSVNVKKFNEKK